MRPITSLGGWVLLALAVGSACQTRGADKDSVVLRAPEEAVPQSVVVTGGEVTVGTVLGRERVRVSVRSFRINRFLVSTAQYRQCMDVGLCSPPPLHRGRVLGA